MACRGMVLAKARGAARSEGDVRRIRGRGREWESGTVKAFPDADLGGLNGLEVEGNPCPGDWAQKTQRLGPRIVMGRKAHWNRL